MSDSAVLLERLVAREDLTREQSEGLIASVLAGEMDPVQIAGLLVALRTKGETAQEIAGMAAAVRRAAVRVVSSRGPLVDSCGSGGGPSTFNISTAVAIVAAGAGAPVAKHGNRSVTSRCGSADVLEALGARVDLSPEAIGQCLDEVGLAFMFAPNSHPAFRHVGPVRKALGVRTIFNLLGPLANPAGAMRQVIGVFDPTYLDRIGEALAELGTEHSLVVAGRDGMDEISTSVPTDAVEVELGSTMRIVIDPVELGIQAPPPEALAGGGPEDNAATIRAVLAGEHGPPRDIVLVNAGALIWLSGLAKDLRDGMAEAAQSIDSGLAADTLTNFVATTQRLGH